MNNKLKYILFFVFSCILSFFTYLGVYAESYTGSATWMYLRIYNSSGTFSKVKHCGGSDAWSGEGQYGNYCIIEPDDLVRTPAAQFNVVSPFTFTKDKQYKIKLTTLGIRADKVSNITVQFTTSSNSYTGFYTFNSFAGVDTDYLDSTNWVLTFIPTADVTVKEMNFKFTFEADNSNDGYGMWSNFTILDIDNSSSTIIDQNETIIDQNKDIINKQDETKNAINALKEQEQKNHEETKEEIKKGFEECRNSYNLLVPSFNSQSRYGLTLTFTENGFIVNGTSTKNFDFFVISNLTLPSGSYILNGIQGSSGSTYQLVVYDKAQGKALAYVQNYSKTFTLTNTSEIQFRFYPYLSSFDNKLFQYQLEKGTTIHPYEPPGEQICKNRIDSTNDKLDDLNDNLTDSDTTGATDSASDFFSGFTSNTFGLTSIITSPLNLIKSLTSKSCTPLNLTIPFVNKPLQLPCMSLIYSEHFSSFLTIYQTITFGITSYWICIRIFALVKDFKNPDRDEIEVMDL